MSQRSSACLWASAYAIRAAFFIYVFGEALSPDTSLYAHGHAWWSSPATAFSGLVGGMSGVKIAGVIGALAVGSVAGWSCARPGYRWFPFLLAFSPPGWYLVQASADGLGTAAAGIAGRATYGRGRLAEMAASIAVAAFHLEAGLCLVFISVVGGGRRRRMVAAVASGALACIGERHLQIRYFLPGLLVIISTP